MSWELTILNKIRHLKADIGSKVSYSLKAPERKSLKKLRLIISIICNHFHYLLISTIPFGISENDSHNDSNAYCKGVV